MIIGVALIALVVAGLFVRRAMKAEAEHQKAKQAALQAKAQKEQPIRTWIDSVEAAGYDDKKLAAVGNPPTGWDDFENVTELAQRQQRAVSSQEELAEKMKDADAHLVRIRQETDPIRQYELLFGVYPYYLSNPDDQKWIESQKCEMIPIYADLLLQQSRAGDGDSFVKLNDLTKLSDSGYQFSLYSLRSDGHYTYPADWNDLAARFYENPSLSDFRFFQANPVEGSIRLMAADALTTRSLRDAKIALAYCSVRNYYSNSHIIKDVWPWRGEIGDVLMADLANMVVAIHSEQKMFIQ